jgi:hypothetical protein
LKPHSGSPGWRAVALMILLNDRRLVDI